jgi:energy-coupling factor transport system permease protein
MPFGSFMNTGSFVHRADPRAKLIFSAAYLILASTSAGLRDILILAASSLVLILLSKLPIAYLWGGLQGLLPLLFVLFVYHLLTHHSLTQAIVVPCKLAFMIVTTTTLTLTTSPRMLTQGLTAILHPLRHFRFPVRKFVLMCSLAFRFMPLLIEEIDMMFKSAQIKNARSGSTGLRTTLQRRLNMFLALLYAVFRRADQLAFAMEARCFPGVERRAVSLRMSWRDAVLIGFAITLVLIRIFI